MKNIARALTPPALWQLASVGWQRLRPNEPRMFSGVYRRFDEVMDQHPWVTAAYLDSCRSQLREAPAIHPSARATHAILTLLINSAPDGVTPRIVDWAGGTGLRFWTTRPSLTRTVDWLVVDDPVLAALGRETAGASSELSFTNALPAPGAPVDVVLVYSALQYVEQHSDLLAALAAHRPRHIVLARFMAHEDRSYVTRQTLHGASTPCRVASIAETTQVLARCGYERVVMMRDGLDLTPLFAEDVPAAMRTGQEWLLVFRPAA